MSYMPWSQTPGRYSERAVAHSMAPFCSFRVDFHHARWCRPFPSSAISGLNPFNLSAYGLHACAPTLKLRVTPAYSKGSLPGGGSALPGRGSHPLDTATLPGRSVLVLVIVIVIDAIAGSLDATRGRGPRPEDRGECKLLRVVMPWPRFFDYDYDYDYEHEHGATRQGRGV